MNLRCPICNEPLICTENRYFCEHGHSFDRAKSGYVNLLLRQSHRTRGDDAAMVAARRNFLDAGFYRPLLTEIEQILKKERAVSIADIGCGEGWYSCNLLKALHENDVNADLCGFDISADALRFAANRTKTMGLNGVQWAVASINHLPLADESCDALLNLFAPCESNEFARVLKPNGLLLRVIPLERHLWQLKEAVYPQPYENRPVIEAPAGFSLDSMQRVETQITISGQSLKDLFAMTPYVRKTSPADAAKLAAMDKLTTEIAFGILICRKCS